jgi:hypothetical protein
MSQTLELSVASTRRHVQATTADVQDWTQAKSPDLSDKARALDRAVSQVIAHNDELMEIDRMFRRIAGNQRPNPEAASRADVLSAQFADYANLIDVTMRSIDDLPENHRPSDERLAELRRLKATAEETASVYRGESEYFRGDPEVSWEEFRKTLGV